MKITRRQLRKIIKEEIERPSAGFRDAIDAIGEEIANLGGHLEHLKDDYERARTLATSRAEELFRANPNYAGLNVAAALREMVDSGQVRSILKRVFEETGSLEDTVRYLFDAIEKRADYM